MHNNRAKTSPVNRFTKRNNFINSKRYYENFDGAISLSFSNFSHITNVIHVLKTYHYTALAMPELHREVPKSYHCQWGFPRDSSVPWYILE